MICLNQPPLDFTGIVARLRFLKINLRVNTSPEPMNDTHIHSAESLAHNTDDLIEDFLEISACLDNSARHNYLRREAMHSLLRLAKSEQLLSIRQSVSKLVPSTLKLTGVQAHKRRRLQAPAQTKQAQFVFGKETQG